MALNRLLFPLALLSLLIAIASAHEYVPNTQNPNNYVANPQQQLLGHDHENQQHDNDLLGSTLNLDVLGDLLGDKQGHNEYHEPQGQESFVPTDPSYEKAKPYYGHQQKSTYNDQVQEGPYPNIDFIGIQGFVLCESEANKYYPLKGAVVEITCPTSYENGYNKASYNTIVRPETDEKGYFREILPIAELTNKYINLKECKAYSKYSPLETCNVPSYSASNGVNLSLLRTEESKAYYTVGNLIYTPNTHYSVPNNDPAAYTHPAPNGY